MSPQRSLPATGVIGLGPMGAPIARNLLAAGVPTVVWNRSPGKAAPMRRAGARIAADPAQLCAPVVLSVLPDVPHLRALLTESVLAAWAKAGTVLVVMSTAGPRQVQALAEELVPHGIRVVDAPMSGGVAGAEAGTLSLMVGGQEDDVAAVRPVLEVIGETVIRMGDLGAGCLAKLCNQVVVAGTLTALAEALGLARAGGLDAEDLVRVLQGGLGRSELLAQKREKLLEREYALGGSAVNQLKDLRYADEVREQLGVRPGVIGPLREVFEEVVARGDGEADHSVVQELFIAAAGEIPADQNGSSRS